jgi:hypothetical protein
MSARPTPETNEEHREITSALGAHHMGFVGLCFARNLERQRDEARELARELLVELTCLHDFFTGTGGVTITTQPIITKAKKLLP